MNYQQMVLEPSRNLRILNQHSFPWTILILLIISPFIVELWKYYGIDFFRKKTLQPVITPQEKALTALDSLKKQEFPEKGLFKEFYFGITEILRSYFEEHYELPAKSLTTEEFLSALSKSPLIPNESKPLFTQFLTLVDYIKFSNRPSTIEECNQSYQIAKQLIKME